MFLFHIAMVALGVIYYYSQQNASEALNREINQLHLEVGQAKSRLENYEKMEPPLIALTVELPILTKKFGYVKQEIAGLDYFDYDLSKVDSVNDDGSTESDRWQLRKKAIADDFSIAESARAAVAARWSEVEARLAKAAELKSLPAPTPTIVPTATPYRENNAEAPSNASAKCRDGSYSFSQHRSGTCSHHGGVAKWLPNAP